MEVGKNSTGGTPAVTASIKKGAVNELGHISDLSSPVLAKARLQD
jgi:hypothetical protein